PLLPTIWLRLTTNSSPSRKQRIRIDGGSLPPLLFRSKHEDSDVQMRRGRIGVAGAAAVADEIAALQLHPFRKTCGVAVEVCVVVRHFLLGIELIDGVAAGL